MVGTEADAAKDWKNVQKMVGLFKPEVKESLEAMIQQLVSRPI